MSIKVGNAPCSWGVEFAGDPRNPSWQTVLKECADAGYQGIELGPIGFMPEDPIELADALAQHKLEMMAGVLYQPFHDASAFDDLMDKAHRTVRALNAHGAQQMVLIDSISERRAPSAGRPEEAVKMDSAEWSAFVERIRTVAKLGTEEYGLTVSIHSHSAGFVDYLPELEQLLQEIDSKHLKLCVDTGHQTYAGFDPVEFMTRHFDRLAYVHFKDIDPAVKAKVIANRTGFYDACGQGIFCNLGKGEVNFNAVKQLLTDRGYNGWITVEQDCDPTLDVSPITDARANREFLASVGF
jgi:inosose dehydratase